MNAEQKPRNILPDTLKGLAVVFMIMIHIVEVIANKSVYESFIGKIILFLGGPPAAPVFMTIMGYFVFKSDKRFDEQLLRGFFLIGGGILLNIGLNLNFLISFFTNRYYFEVNPWQYILGADILPLAGLSVLILSLIKRIGLKWYWIVLLIFLVAIMGNVFPEYQGNIHFVKYILAFVCGPYKWSYFPLLPWLAYPLLGFLYAKTEQTTFYSKYSSKVILLSPLIAILVFIFSHSFILDATSRLTPYYHHGIEMFLWIGIFLLGYFSLFSMVLKKISDIFIVKGIAWIGKNVTSFYVFQWLIIGNVGTEIYKRLELIESVAIFSGVIIITALFTFFWNKFRPHFQNFWAE